jgi:hypothetical protein
VKNYNEKVYDEVLGITESDDEKPKKQGRKQEEQEG